MTIRQVGAGSAPTMHPDVGPSSSNPNQPMGAPPPSGHQGPPMQPTIQRRTASGSNVQFLQQGQIPQGQGQSYMVVPSSSSANVEGRVQYVQQGRGGYANTLVMRGNGRVVRPTGAPMQQRVFIAPERQYTIPSGVPVRVMPSNQQRMMPGQRRNPPAPGTVAAMVLPARNGGGAGGVPQMRTMQ
uniref:Uncharacterized protein n=1 Tax=Caenorhabditis japonica TaxID=281687 RepID=A0A8R1IIZ0_CAEJA